MNIRLLNVRPCSQVVRKKGRMLQSPLQLVSDALAVDSEHLGSHRILSSTETLSEN